jgi:hypothetical protein
MPLVVRRKFRGPRNQGDSGVCLGFPLVRSLEAQWQWHKHSAHGLPGRVQRSRKRLSGGSMARRAGATVVSSSEITTTVPADAATGDVEVVTPGSPLSSNVSFRLLP